MLKAWQPGFTAASAPGSGSAIVWTTSAIIEVQVAYLPTSCNHHTHGAPGQQCVPREVHGAGVGHVRGLVGTSRNLAKSAP